MRQPVLAPARNGFLIVTRALKVMENGRDEIKKCKFACRSGLFYTHFLSKTLKLAVPVELKPWTISPRRIKNI